MLCEELSGGVGVVALSRSNLDETALSELCQILADQPAWSHVPIIVINQSQNRRLCRILRRWSAWRRDLLDAPVRLGSLVTSVRSAIAYRRRQYQTRDLLEQLEASRKEAEEANRAKATFWPI